MPVWVHLAVAFPPGRVSSTRGVPLRVRAFGIDNSATVAGELLAWHRALTGDWFALTRFEVANRSRRGRLVVTQFVPARAVTPRDEGSVGGGA